MRKAAHLQQINEVEQFKKLFLENRSKNKPRKIEFFRTRGLTKKKCRKMGVLQKDKNGIPEKEEREIERNELQRINFSGRQLQERERELSRYICEAYGHKERKGHPRIASKIEETVSKL